MIYSLFVVLIVIAALLMIAIVLIQESKGGGLSSQFSSSNSIMGVRKTTDFVEKATWTLAALLVVFSVATSFFVHQESGDAFDVANIKTTAPAMPAPAAPAKNQAAPANQATTPAAETPAPSTSK